MAFHAPLQIGHADNHDSNCRIPFPRDILAHLFTQYLSIHDFKNMDVSFRIHEKIPGYYQGMKISKWQHSLSSRDIVWMYTRGISVDEISMNGFLPKYVLEILSVMTEVAVMRIDGTYMEDVEQIKSEYLEKIEDKLRTHTSPLNRKLRYLSIAKKCYVPLRQILRLVNNCPQLTHLSLLYPKYTCDMLLQIFRTCKNILSLDISGNSKLTHKIFSAISQRHSSLTSINLSDCHAVTDEAIRIISESCNKLRSINLSGCRAGNDSIIAVSQNCPNLTDINISRCYHPSDNAVIALSNGCHQLQSIDLSDCNQISDASIINICQRCPLLQSINLQNLKLLTETSVISISENCSNLTSVNLCNLVNISDSAIILLSQRCCNITDIHLGGKSEVSDNGIISLAQNFPRLTSIELGLSAITNESVVAIAQYCHSLTRVMLRSLDVSDMSIIALSNLSSLQSLVIHRCQNITVQSFDGLENGFPSLSSIEIAACRNLSDESSLRGILLKVCPKLTPENFKYTPENLYHHSF